MQKRIAELTKAAIAKGAKLELSNYCDDESRTPTKVLGKQIILYATVTEENRMRIHNGRHDVGDNIIAHISIFDLRGKDFLGRPNSHHLNDPKLDGLAEAINKL